MLKRRAKRLHLLKREGMPPLARPELTLMQVEGALGVNIVTPREEHIKIEKLLLCHTKPPYTRFSVQ